MGEQADSHLLAPFGEAQIALLISRNADGIIVVDQGGRVRFANPVAETLLGAPLSALVGADFGYPLARAEHTEIELGASAAGGPRIAEMRVAAISWDGSPAQLVSLRDVSEQHRIREALRDAESFNWSILNALNDHIAVLDEHGTIVAVNGAWRAFAQANGDPNLRATDIGSNYFSVCSDSIEARRILEGLQEVLVGARPGFEIEYPCHSPVEERWFQMRAVPLRSAQRSGLVISHANITEQRRNAHAAAEATTLRAQLRARSDEISAVEQLSQGAAPPPAARKLSDTALHPYVERYCVHLDRAVAERAFQRSSTAGPDLRRMADQLAEQHAAPRDLIALHLAALRQSSANAPTSRQQAYLEEGRILVLELMGYLANCYRARALGGPLVSHPMPGSE